MTGYVIKGHDNLKSQLAEQGYSWIHVAVDGYKSASIICLYVTKQESVLSVDLQHSSSDRGGSREVSDVDAALNMGSAWIKVAKIIRDLESNKDFYLSYPDDAIEA